MRGTTMSPLGEPAKMSRVELSRFVQGTLPCSVHGRTRESRCAAGLAISFYQRDRDRESPAWVYPGFLPGARPGADSSVIEVEVDGSAWASFAAEAERQGVEARQLAEHAALYFAAAIDAGLAMERMLGDQESAG